MELGDITTEEKIRFLIHGACADSAHDFGHSALGFNKTRSPDKPGLYHLIQGLPNTERIPSDLPGVRDRDGVHNEDEMLGEMFPIVYKDMGSFIQGLRDELLRNIDIKTINGTEGYQIKVLHKDRDSNIKNIWNKLTDDDYIEFFNKDPDINLLFDAGCIDIMGLLKCATRGSTMQQINFNRIVNREVINDPAPKTYSDARGKLNNESLMTFAILFDAQKGAITYEHFNHTKEINNTPLQRDKFYSNLDFRISDLKSTKGGLPSIDITVLQNNGERVYENNDPHTNNRIAMCVKRIIDFLKTNKKNHIAASAHFQCKRSGDWLQAISCLDLKREYTSAIEIDGGEIQLLPGNKIIIVTHDRILLWYALFLGIDVLFTYKPGLATTEITEENEIEKISESERVLVYFSNVRNSLRPEQIQERNIEFAKSNIKQVDKINELVSLYNKAIVEIKKKRISAIGSFYGIIQGFASEDIIQQPPLKKPKIPAYAPPEFRNITLLLQEYIRFTSIDYIDIDISPLLRMKSEFESKLDNKKALQFLSIYNSFSSRFISLGIDISQAAPSLDGMISIIETSNNAYKNDPLFSDTPILYQPSGIRETRKDSNLDPNIAIIALATFLCERLDAQMTHQLIEQLQFIKNRINLFKLKITSLDIFLPKLLMNAKQNLGKVELPSKQAIAEYIDAVKSEFPKEGDKNIGYTETTTVFEATRIGEEVSEELDILKGSSGQDLALIPEIVESGIIPPIRKIVNTIFSFSKTFHSIVGSLSKTLQRFMQSGGVREESGTTDGQKEDNLYAYFLVMAYIYQNFSNLTGTDPYDFDFIYYETLSILLISTLDVVKNDWKALVNILYVDYSDGIWGNMFEETADYELFDRNMIEVAYANANQAINSIKTELIQLKYNDQRDYIDKIQTNYYMISQKLKGFSYERRMQYIVGKLREAISKVYSEKQVDQVFPGLYLKSGLNIKNRPKHIINKSPKVHLGYAIGGKKTRKHGGKPSRKDLSKSRRKHYRNL